ncbi:hypothetical protein CL619_01670 [archaeon]|nr:hypothetical protein [archaeon]|tara:strand:- start:2747 stop:3292 length:546 start_codon:yes stop_codon:yes gene_type:complete
MTNEEYIADLVRKLTLDKDKVHFEDLESHFFDLIPDDVSDEELIRDFNDLGELTKRQLLAKHYVNIGHSMYEFVEPCEGEIWLKPENNGTAYFTQIPVSFLVENLDVIERDRVFDPDYLPERSTRIRTALDSGIVAMSFTPIIIHYNIKKNKFMVTDGIHRIQVFNERGFPYINAQLSLEK